MAITDINNSQLTFTSSPIGVQVTKVTDSSADWSSVPNSTYFYDKADKLVHYKDGTGAIQEMFTSAGGLTNFTETGTTVTPNATVPVNSLTATGAATNIDIAIVPKGTGAFILAVPDNTSVGGNKRGDRAVDLQMNRGVATGTRVASGVESFAVGTSNTASGSNSFTIGSSNLATNSWCGSIGDSNTTGGQYAYAFGQGNASSTSVAFSLGYANTSSGFPSFTFGRSNISSGTASYSIGESNISNGLYSFSFGRQAHTFGIEGRQVYASGQEGTAGDAQASKFILRRRTTTNGDTSLTTNGAAPSATNQVILSNNSAYRFKGSIVGKQSGSVNAAVWDIDGFIVRGANAAATTLNISNVTLVQNTPAWGTPTIIADTTNGGVNVRVNGASATNIQWTAVIDTTEVIYA